MDEAARKRFGINYPLASIEDRQTIYLLRPPRRRWWNPRRWGVKVWALIASHLLAMLIGGIGIAWLALRHAL